MPASKMILTHEYKKYLDLNLTKKNRINGLSVIGHWFSKPILRNWVHQLSFEAPNKGLTLDVINSIDGVKAWPVLRQMHVKLVSLPCAGNQVWIDSHQNTNRDWQLISKDVGGICLSSSFLLLANYRPSCFIDIINFGTLFRTQKIFLN
jgi:hypothetical protein